MLQNLAQKVRTALGLFTQADVNKQIELAHQDGCQSENNRLATELFKRGGFASLQLNPDPHGIPRMRFIEPHDAKPVDAMRLDTGIIILRNPA